MYLITFDERIIDEFIYLFELYFQVDSKFLFQLEHSNFHVLVYFSNLLGYCLQGLNIQIL